MLAALLCNQPYTVPSNGDYEETRRRRPNEPVIWCDDDNIRCQDELTAFKAKPEDEQKAIVAEALETVKAAPQADFTIDAQEAIEEFQALEDLMCQVECLNILLLTYFRLTLENKRQQDEIAAMLLLGVL